MKKLKKKIKTVEDFERFTTILFERVVNKQPISDNPMLDGMIIGFIFSTMSFTKTMFVGELQGHVLDGTIQKLEQIAIWCTNNEEELCRIL